MKDEVISALWKVKDEISREHDYDLERLAVAVRRREQEHPERVVNWSRARQPAGSEAARDT